MFATPHRPLVLVAPRSGREIVCLCMHTDLLTMWVQLRSSSDKGGHRHCHRPSISTSSLHRRRHSSATTAKTGHLGARGPDGRAVGSGGPWLGRGEMNGAVLGQVDMGRARRGGGATRGGVGRQARLAVMPTPLFGIRLDERCRIRICAFGRASRQAKMVQPRAHELDSLRKLCPSSRISWMMDGLVGCEAVWSGAGDCRCPLSSYYSPTTGKSVPLGHVGYVKNLLIPRRSGPW